MGRGALGVAKAVGLDKAWSAAKSLGSKAWGTVKQAAGALKERFAPLIDVAKQAASVVVNFSPIGMACKFLGCAAQGLTKGASKGSQAATDLATDLIPGVSTVKDGCTCITGTNCVTGEHTSGAERGVACASAAVDVAGLVAAPFTGGGSLAASTAAKAALKTGVKAAVKAALRRGAKEVAEEAAERVIKEVAGEAAERAVKEVAGEVAERAAKSAAGDAAERAARRAAGEAAERVPESAAEWTAKETAERAARDAAEQSAKDAADHAARKTAKEGTERAGERGAREGAGSAGETGTKHLDETAAKRGDELTEQELDRELVAIGQGSRRPGHRPWLCRRGRTAQRPHLAAGAGRAMVPVLQRA